MQFVMEKVSQDAFYANLLLGLPEALANVGIDDVLIERVSGLTESEIVQWETKNGVRLPDNIRDFYASTDGLFFSWIISKPFSEMNDTEGSEEQADDEDEEPSGKIMINPLRDLGAISGFTISDVPGIKVNEKEFHLAPGTNSKIFALEELDSGATIVLVYTHVDRKPTIWLYTKEKKFYFLAKHFIRYLRMAVAYWGIPDWQFVFTKQEVSEMTLELLQVFVPHILSMTERYDVISSNITKLSKSDEDFVAALLNENDSDSICDDDFPDTPVNEIDSDFFLHATNPQTAAPNSVVDMTASTSNKVEKKTPTAKSRLTPTKFKRKPLYYIKQRPQ